MRGQPTPKICLCQYPNLLRFFCYMGYNWPRTDVWIEGPLRLYPLCIFDRGYLADPSLPAFQMEVPSTSSLLYTVNFDGGIVLGTHELFLHDSSSLDRVSLQCVHQKETYAVVGLIQCTFLSLIIRLTILKYITSCALTLGASLASIFCFFALSFWGIELNWWGNGEPRSGSG